MPLQTMTNKMKKHDRLSLALHAAIKRELLSDPERVLTVAKNNLERWRCNYIDVSKWMSDWTEILHHGVSAVVKVLDGEDEVSTHLRSSSPFTGIISQKERAVIIKEHNESFH